jgi:hypothetical protein
VAALLAAAVEDVEPDGVDWFVARLTVELERPVPLAALRLETVVTRPGRKVSLVEATIARADTAASSPGRVRCASVRPTCLCRSTTPSSAHSWPTSLHPRGPARRDPR